MAFPNHSPPIQLKAACPSCAGGHRGQLMPFPPLPWLEGADLLWARGWHLWSVEGVRCTQLLNPTSSALVQAPNGAKNSFRKPPKREKDPENIGADELGSPLL